MPMLKFRGITKREIVLASTELIDKLAKIIDCPRDYFTLELVDSMYIMDGEVVKQPSLIEIAWFDRGQEVQDEVAKLLTESFKKDRECLEIFFIKLETSSYYENGKHF